MNAATPEREIAVPHRIAEQPSAPSTPALPQPSSHPRIRGWTAALPIGLLVAAVMSVVGFFALRPRIVGLAVPNSAQAGSLVTISYRATGLGTADYTVLRPEGQTLMHAPLRLGTGTIALTLPKAPATQTYLLRLRAVNGLVSSTADYYISVPVAERTARRLRGIVSAARPAADFPQIHSLALDRATLASGDGLGVYYDVAASSGTIALVDSASHITYEKASLDASGHTSFTMPNIPVSRLLTIVLTAQRGTQTVQSRVGVNVVAANASPAPSTGDRVRANANGSFPSDLSAPRTVRSRQPIHVDVLGASGDAQVVLRDAGGSEFERRDVRAGQQRVEFTAPDVHTTTHFTLEATIPEGDGNETLVREIAVTP
jgi:hypothetical protein